jgi:hypothetical protein
MPLTAPPNRRMAIDADGSTVLVRYPTAGDPSFQDLDTKHGAGSIASLNSEENSGFDPDPNEPVVVVIIFPELRDITHYFIAGDPSTTGTISEVATSVNTTNGIDGTWVTHGSPPSLSQDVYGDYRDPTAWTQSGVRAIRATLDGMAGSGDEWAAFHVWGTIASGESPDRLEWIDDGTTNPYTTAEDYGDVPRGSSEDLTVRLRNLSASLTANSVVVSAESLYSPGGDDPASWFTFSTNGGAGPFTSTINIASIGPGAEQLIEVRRVTPDTVIPNHHAPRLKAVVGSWT